MDTLDIFMTTCNGAPTNAVSRVILQILPLARRVMACTKLCNAHLVMSALFHKGLVSYHTRHTELHTKSGN